RGAAVVAARDQPGRVGGRILQAHTCRGGREGTDAERDQQHQHGQDDRELGCDRAAIVSGPAAHDTVSARRTRSVRMPRTSSERMITTSSPAKATAAIVAMAYSAVAAPDSSVNSRAERRRVRRGTVMGLSLSVGGHGLGEAGTGSGSEGQG